jgi:hypothetical protein
MYNSIGHKNELLYGYETIQGKNPKDALKKHFDKDFQRLTGDARRYSDVILVKGTYNKESNNIILSGKYQQLCYGVVN